MKIHGLKEKRWNPMSTTGYRPGLTAAVTRRNWWGRMMLWTRKIMSRCILRTIRKICQIWRRPWVLVHPYMTDLGQPLRTLWWALILKQLVTCSIWATGHLRCQSLTSRMSLMPAALVLPWVMMNNSMTHSRSLLRSQNARTRCLLCNPDLALGPWWLKLSSNLARGCCLLLRNWGCTIRMIKIQEMWNCRPRRLKE